MDYAEYAIGFFVGIATCFVAVKCFTGPGSRGISYYKYLCSSKTAKFTDTGNAPLKVWAKVYQPAPSPPPGSNPVAAGATAASKVMGEWQATNSTWPNTGTVYVYGWFEQTLGVFNIIGPYQANCDTAPPPPPVPPLPPVPPPPLPPPPPPMGGP